MTNTMPDDQAMVSVMAEVYGDGKPPLIYEGEGQSGRFVWFSPGRVSTSRVDPRHDTDAAMELLGWLIEKYSYDLMLSVTDEGWKFYTSPELPGVQIPISGPAFRAAVCNLAVELIGGE